MSDPTLEAAAQVVLLVALLALVASVGWIYEDARRLHPSGARRFGVALHPLAWALGALLLWVVVFPMYLRRRRVWTSPRAAHRPDVAADGATTAEPSAERLSWDPPSVVWPGVRPLPRLPGAGWYDDPEIAGQRRWWDGHRWSDHRCATGSAGQRPEVPTLGSVPGESW